jgi:hypothetical protein
MLCDGKGEWREDRRNLCDRRSSRSGASTNLIGSSRSGMECRNHFATRRQSVFAKSRSWAPKPGRAQNHIGRGCPFNQHDQVSTERRRRQAFRQSSKWVRYGPPLALIYDPEVTESSLDSVLCGSAVSLGQSRAPMPYERLETAIGRDDWEYSSTYQV